MNASPLSFSALSDSRSVPIAPTAANRNDTPRIFLRPNLLKQSYQEKRINLKVSRLCLKIKNDRIWLLWNNGGNSFKIHAGLNGRKISNIIDN